MKLVADTLLGVGMQAIAESVALGQKEGLDRHRLLEVLSHTAVIAPAHLDKLSRGHCQLNSSRHRIRHSNKMNSSFGNWSVDDRVDANYFLPYGESRLHHVQVTTSSAEMSPHSKE